MIEEFLGRDGTSNIVAILAGLHLILAAFGKLPMIFVEKEKTPQFLDLYAPVLKVGGFIIILVAVYRIVY